MATIICILLHYQGSKTILSGHLVPQPDHLNCWRHSDVTHNIWSHTFTVFCNTCTPLCQIKFELMTISLCHLPTDHRVNTKSILQSFCSNLTFFSNFGCRAKGDLQQKKNNHNIMPCISRFQPSFSSGTMRTVGRWEGLVVVNSNLIWPL